MKIAWLRRTNELFGNCGKIAYVDGVAEGFAQYAPPGFFPRVAEYQAGPPSQEAVLISCLFIPRHRFRTLGLGSHLLDNVLAELKQKGIGAVETFARKGKADNPSGPAAFYFRNGFSIYRDDAEYPLLVWFCDEHGLSRGLFLHSAFSGFPVYLEFFLLADLFSRLSCHSSSNSWHSLFGRRGFININSFNLSMAIAGLMPLIFTSCERTHRVP